MTGIGDHFAESLDPVLLARRLGWEPDAWQADALRSTAPRAVVCAHRQGGKSQVAALKAVHVAAYEPGALVLLISPSQRQSDELFRRCSTFWRAMGKPVPAEADNRRSLELENGSRIVSLPGDEGTVRGFAACRLVIIDEAAWVKDDVLSAVSPMLAVSSGGQLLMISTPFGKRGFFYESATRAELRYEVTVVPATECRRISAEFLESELARLGDLKFRSEYLVEFIEGQGSVFDAAAIRAALSGDVEPFDPHEEPPRLRLVPTREAS